MKEADLYPPVKQFLEAQGYTVKGEIRECDVVAVRGSETPVVVELKLSLNLGVLLQAVDRIAVADHVYIGVPKGCGILKKKPRRVVKLLRMLGLGLMEIGVGHDADAVRVVVDPGKYKPRKSKKRQERLLGEFMMRIGDPNPGGSAKRRGIMTAYRQRALALAHYLEKNGPAKAAHVASALEDPKARNILYRDVYGWFDRVGFGTYALSPRGKREFPMWAARATGNGEHGNGERGGRENVP
ncbi:MAG: DUF2161 family putative PD-(D/E)XK-type phosphodiesterase [Desulfobacter sp.]